MVPSRRPLFPSLRRKACLKLAGFESLDILRLSMSDLSRRILDLESGPYTRWNVIPNIETVATYSFNTQTIELCDIGSEEYRKSLAGDIALQRKITVLLAHEIRHWLDHVGSLWGQQLLCLGYNALNARLLNQPGELWRVIAFRQALRDNRFEQYYTTIESGSPAMGRRMWKYQMSTGARFNHSGKLSELHPILFTRFSWEDNSPACRVPMSVASLLETAAMDYELRAEQAFVSLLDPKEQREASEALQSRYLDLAYDPNLAEYSVAVHAVSNFVGPKDCPGAFQLSSILASIALNLTKDHFTTMRVPESFHTWGQRNDAFIRNGDRGYAFLVLAKSAPRVPIDNVDEWVERTLENSGLPPLKIIKKDAGREIDNLTVNVLDGPFSKLRDENLSVGRKIFEQFGPVFKFESVLKALTKSTLSLPPIILGKELEIVAGGETSPNGIRALSAAV